MKAAEEAASAARENCFDLLDSLDGLSTLTKRTPTLDGSVPVRVARACVPLLEGNAFGWQISLTRPVLVRRRLGRWTVGWEGGNDGVLDALHEKRLSRLIAAGRVATEGRWTRRLHGPVVRAKGRTVQLTTGLLVRPDPGHWLRISSTANRRNVLFEVVPQVVLDDGGLVPLVLELRLAGDAPAAFRIAGEVATIAPLQSGVSFQTADVADAPDLAHAHAAFYDRAYFETKKEDVTGRYRRLVAAEEALEDRDRTTTTCRVVSVGPARIERVAIEGLVTSSGEPPAADPRGRPLETLLFRNEVAFRAQFDGHTLTLDYDRKALAAKARRVEAALADALGGTPEHPGAGLYLSKYFTPHPPGEPHFFVKPWAFTQTPPGWSCLLEGIHGEGYDVLRGVVSTDVFHATPAVFQVRRVGAPIRVPEGAPLLRVIPVPRRLLGAGYRLLRLD